MSYNITGTTITLTRGDTFEALVSATKRDGTSMVRSAAWVLWQARVRSPMMIWLLL